jgi:hypothetical protein
MSLVKAINFFSSYGSDECFILTNKNNKFYLNKNYSINNSLCTSVLSDGIYFELLSGNLNDTNNLNQTFVIKIKNPNSIQVSNNYSIRIYNSNDQLLYETFLPSNLDGLELSYQSVNQTVSYIALTANSKFIYSTEDLKLGYIPLDQRYTATYYNPLNQVVGETYLFREIFSGLYFSNPNYRQTSIYKSISSIVSNNITLFYLGRGIGSNKLQILTDFKFPSQYRFLPNTNKYYLSGYSILSYLFSTNILSSLNESTFTEFSTYNSLPKAANKLLYKEYYYNENNLQYEPISAEVSILDILLSIYTATKIPYLLTISYNIYSDILIFLKTFSLSSGVFYPKLPIPNTNASLLPDSIIYNQNTFTLPSIYSLGTNLFFINILDISNENINPWIKEIERVFFDENAVGWDVNTKYSNISDPLQAALIKTYLNIYKNNFDASYLTQINSLISQANNFLISNYYSLSSVSINGDVTSNSYNPIYSLSPNYIRIYTNDIYKNIFISFFLGEDLQKYLTLGVDGTVLDSLTYVPTSYKLILPSLRSTITLYNLSLISSYKTEAIKESNAISLIQHDTRLAGNLLISTIEFSEPVKILAILKIGSSIISYVTSLVPSTTHTVQFSSTAINSSNYSIELYTLL